MVDRFRNFFDSLTEEVVVVDRALRVSYANPAWIRRVGLSLSQIRDQSCHKILQIANLSCDPHFCACQRVFETGQPVRLACPLSGDGGEVEGDISASPVFDDSGVIQEVILVHYSVEGPPDVDAKHVSRQPEVTTAEPDMVGAFQVAMLLTSSGVGLRDVLDSILEQLIHVVDYDSASIALLEKDGWRIIAGRGFPPDSEVMGLALPLDGEKSAWMQDTKQPLIIHDVLSDHRWLPIEGSEHIRSWIGAPLLVQGEMIGILNLDKVEPGYYQPEDAQVALAFANQAAVVIENVRLLESERQRVAQLRLIGEISQRVLSILDPEAFLDHAVQAIQRQFGYYFVGVLLVDPSGEHVTVRANSRPAHTPGEAEQELRFRVGVDGICGHVAATGQAYIANDVGQDPLYIPDKFLLETQSELVVPIKFGERILGVLDVNSDRVNDFGDDDLFVAQSLADQLAIGLENARLFAAEARRRREAETLRAATQALSLTLDLQSVFGVILSELQKVVPYDSASVQRIKENRLEIIGGHGFPNLEELLGVSFDLMATDNPNARVVETQAPYILNDAPAIYDEFSREPHAQAGIRSWLGVPLLFGKRLIGMIALDKQEPGFYTGEHARLALAFGAHAAVAIENAALFDSTAQRVAELEAVRQATLSLTSSLELQAVLESILQHTVDLLTGVQDAHIFLYQDGHLSFGAALWADGRKGQPWAHPRPQGLTYTVARHGEPIVVPDMRTHPLFVDTPESWKGSIVGLPLKIGERVVGVMTVAFDKPRALPETEMNVLRLLADQVAIAIENARLFDAEHQSRLRLKSIQATATALSAELHFDTLLDQIVTETAKAFSAEATSLMLWSEDEQYLVVRASHGLAENYSRNQRISRARVYQAVPADGSPAPLYVPDLVEAPYGDRDLIKQEGIRSALIVPLGRQMPISGILNIYSKKGPRSFDPSEIELAGALAAHAEVMIANAQLYRQTQDYAMELASRAERLALVNRISSAVSSTLDLDQLLQTAVREMAQALSVRQAGIILFDEEAGRGLVVADYQEQPDDTAARVSIPLDGNPLLNRLLSTRQPVAIHDARKDPLASGIRDVVQTRSIRSMLIVPLTVKDKVIGSIGFDAINKPRTFTGEEIELAQTIANQVAIAIENAQLYQETQQRLKELALLFESSVAVSTSLDLDRVLHTTAALIIEAVGVEGCSISIWDQKQNVLVTLLDLSIDPDRWPPEEAGTTYPLAEYPDTRRVLGRRTPATVQAADPQAAPSEVAWMRREGIRSLVMIPMIVRDKVVGLMELAQFTRARVFAPTQINLCQTVANQAAAAVENARLFQETEARVREMTALAAVGQASTTLELDDVLDIVAENALQAAQAEISSVYLLDEERGLLLPKSVHGLRWEELNTAIFALGEGTIGRVAQLGEPLVVEDSATDPRFAHKTEAAAQIRNTLTVPLVVKERIIGTLEVCNKIAADGFTLTDERLLGAFAAQAAIAIENARLFQAERDQRELAEALQQAASVVGSTLDLDQVLDHILEQAGRVIPSSVANVMLIDGEQVRVVRWRGYDKFAADELVASLTFELADTVSLRQMQETGKALVISDTAAYTGWLQFEGQEWLRSYAGAPIRVRDEVIGFLNVDSGTPGFFTQIHADRLQAFADQASLAIANARLYQEVSRHLEEVLILNRFTRATASTLRLDDVLRRGLSALVGTRNFERVHVLLLDEEKGELWLHPALSDLFHQREAYRIALGKGIAGRVAQTGNTRRVADVRQEPGYIEGYADTRSELCVPLWSGNRVIGVLDVQSTRLGAFSESDERFLTTMAGHLSTVIENTDLFGEAQQRVRELTALMQVSQALNRASDLGSLLDTVLEEAFSLLEGGEGSVILIDPPNSNRLRIVAERGLGQATVEAFNDRPVYTHEGTYSRALRSGRIVEVPDTQSDPDFLEDVGSRARAVTNVPLTTERGTIGLIAVDGLPKDETTRRLLRALADMAAMAIDKERLGLETSNRLAEVTTLYTLATQITDSLSLETVMDSIVTILKLTLDCRACSIWLVDSRGEYLQCEAGSGLLPGWKGVARLRVGEGVSGRVLAERRSIYVPDTQLEPGFIFFDPNIRSLLVVPLIVRNKAIGTLSIDDIKPNAFDDEVRLLTIAAAQAAVAIENAQLYESLQKSYMELERAYAELKHLDQMKSEFVQNISHELRTPLTFIKGYIELLQDGDMGALNKEQGQAMRIVATKADALARLVDDIISLQQAGRAQLNFEIISLAEVGHAAVQAARASAAEVGITLHDDIPAGLPDVQGDRQRLYQVFDNLLGNALKFSEAGDRVSIRMIEEEEVVRTEIEDTGIGIPSDQLTRIFERFYQVDGTTTRRHGGTGLGLAIVKQIVEIHGGQVGVRSKVGKGSTFYFTIPKAGADLVEGGKGQHAD